MTTNIENCLAYQKCVGEKDLQMKSEEERNQENFVSYVEDYYELNQKYKKNGISQIHHDFNKQKFNHQTSYREDSLKITLSKHINGLASTITCNYGRNKQDKI